MRQSESERDAGLADRCLAVAATVGERLATPQAVGEYHAVVSAQLPYYRERYFESSCLFLGTAGTAMLHVALFEATQRQAWADNARRHIDFAASSLVDRGAGTGVLGGVAGLLAAAAYASRAFGGYARLRARLAAFLLDRARSTLDSVKRQGSAPMRTYDLFDGLSGTCIALAKEGVPEAAGIIGELADWLSEDNERWRTKDPGGGDATSNDIGLAHGIGGVLAALGLCPPTPAGARAARRIIDWLAESIDTTPDALWPHRVHFSDPALVSPRRLAWCYGVLGLASSVWVAAARYGYEDAKAWSLQALERIGVPPARPGTDFALCHGLAGIALVTHAMAVAGPSAVLERTSRTFLDATLDARDDELDLCYRTEDPEGLVADSAGLGEGAAGIALAALTCANLAHPSWVEYFGLPSWRS